MIAANSIASQVETPDGPIEYVVQGSGPPVLYFHGTPNSAQLVMELERQLIADGFQLIVPNRPGYYGTPLAGRTTTAACADMAARLLDHLGIDCVAVIGTSGGGLPALAFASLYPQRTVALVLQCALTHCWDDPRWGPTLHRWLYGCLRRRWSRHMFCKFFPVLFRMGFPTTDRYLHCLTGARYSDLQSSPDARQFAESIYSIVANFRQVRQGYQNDLSNLFCESVLSRGRMNCTTLLLHDQEDPQVPFCHAQFAASAIHGAELVELHSGGHLIWFGRDADLMQERRTAFLRKHLGGHSG